MELFYDRKLFCHHFVAVRMIKGVQRMIVICLEGCHGSGKSELIGQFKKEGFNVLDEGFLNMPSYDQLHPQTLTMELMWVSEWFKRILDRKENQKGDKTGIYIVDRSPFSAAYYARRGGALIESLIEQQLEELKTLSNIHIYTIHVKVDRPLLWQRIEQRLKAQPFRKQLNEDKIEWMDRTLAFYNHPDRKWDFEVYNNTNSIRDCFHGLIDTLCTRVDSFQDSYLSWVEDCDSPVRLIHSPMALKFKRNTAICF